MTIEIHRLKTDPSPFRATQLGIKTFEIRKFDRAFKPGDLLILQETLHSGIEMEGGEPLIYTGQELVVKVEYIMLPSTYALTEGWCIMSVKLV